MLYRKLYIENAAELRDIRVENGKFAEIGANLAAKPGEDVRDFGGCLALPPLIEIDHVVDSRDAGIVVGDLETVEVSGTDHLALLATLEVVG